MDFETINLPEFKIIGITIRTTNENGKSRGDISELWKRFYKEDVKNKIPNKVDDEVIALYIDYEKDFMKPYTMVIGCRVDSLDNIPDGLVGKNVPSAKFAVFSVKGKMPDELIKTWKDIWASDLPRAYMGDFEIHGKNSTGENAEMKVYLSVR